MEAEAEAYVNVEVQAQVQVEVVVEVEATVDGGQLAPARCQRPSKCACATALATAG